MKHLFFDENLSHPDLALCCVVVIDEDNRQKLKDILALPNREEFGTAAYDLLYCIDGTEKKPPEYSFRRMLKAYFTEFDFQKKVQDKIDSVFNALATLDFLVCYSIYRKKLDGAPQTWLKSFYTSSLLKIWLADHHDEIEQSSLLLADKGFYGFSEDMVFAKTYFRAGRSPTIGITTKNDPDLKRRGLVFVKELLIEPSYDRKEIQLADICAGVGARALFHPQKVKTSEFYRVIEGKVNYLLDNQKHSPFGLPGGSIVHPLPYNSFYGLKIDKPNLLRTKIGARE